MYGCFFKNTTVLRYQYCMNVCVQPHCNHGNSRDPTHVLTTFKEDMTFSEMFICKKIFVLGIEGWDVWMMLLVKNGLWIRMYGS